MLNTKSYVPILKWKQGEYTALKRLSPDVRAATFPLIEVTPPEYDFEKEVPKRNIDEQLKPFAKRYKDNWGESRAFLDLHMVGDSYVMKDGRSPIEFIFSELEADDFHPIPVTSIDRSAEFQAAIAQTILKEQQGVCVRLTLNHAFDTKLSQRIETLLADLVVEYENADLVIDLQSPNFDPIESFAKAIVQLINRIPHLNRWRSFILCGSSFPKSMGEIKQGNEFVERKEWLLYKQLTKILPDKIPSPVFGDYAIDHPQYLNLDMRMIKPSASLRYTVDDNWLIFKGNNVRDNGYEQYHEICEALCNSEHFMGDDYSAGDDCIQKCANHEVGTGNLTTWRWVGTNHHITKIVDDLSTLADS